MSTSKKSPTQSKSGTPTAAGVTRKASKRELFTTENSLNPVLRINRNAAPAPASASTASATALTGTASASSSVPSSPTSNKSSIPISSSRRLSNAKDRHRKTSSTDSLRRAIETQRAPSPSGSRQPQESPAVVRSSTLRRSSSSHSSINIDSSSLPIRPGTPAPAVHTDVPFPTSPTPSTISVASTSASFDALKSSLRDTLHNDGSARSGHASNHNKRRSVSFAVDEELMPASDIVNGASGDNGHPDPSTPPKKEARSSDEDRTHIINFESPGTASSGSSESPLTSTPSSSLSSPVRKGAAYPVTQWEPLSPDTGEITFSERANVPNPLDLAKQVFSFMQMSSTDDVDDPVSPKSRVTTRNFRGGRKYDDVGTVRKAAELAVGFWLAAIWLVIGRFIGSKR